MHYERAPRFGRWKSDGSLRYRVVERTSSRAKVSLAKVSAFHGALFDSYRPFGARSMWSMLKALR
jgi:hypothetical protein